MDGTIPDKFKSYLKEAVGSVDCATVLEAIASNEPVVSIRLNPCKPIQEHIDSVVNIAKEDDDRVPWCNDGYYLKMRPDFTLDPTLHAGAYYVQDASSMFLSLLEPLIKDRRSILDLCAAPGGKSTHLISMKSPDAAFTANEVIRSRFSVLKENLSKWGDHSVEMLSLDPAEFGDRQRGSNMRIGALRQFDLILVDAPCSGEGLFRKDWAAMVEWSEESVQLCAARQRRILADIWGSLAPGGDLIYSTCTFNRYENEENVLWLIEEYDAEIIPLERIVSSQSDYTTNNRQKGASFQVGNIDLSVTSDNMTGELSLIEEWGIRKSGIVGYRFLPGVVRGEGQFFAVIRKRKESQRVVISDDRANTPRIMGKMALQTGRKIIGKDKYKCDADYKERANQGTKVQPEAEDALSIDYNKEYPSIELTKSDALKFLSREAIILKDAPLGYLRVMYGGLGLGFVKNIGSRANNLYPLGWKIRKRI